MIDHLIVDPISGAAERQLAQGREIAGLEERVRGAGGRLGQVDAPLAQPGDELGRGDVDQHDLVGFVEHRVGHGLAHRDPGDARHHIGQAFEMLDVESRPHVDAGIEEFGDILVALRVATLGRVRMRELVDDHQRRLADERRIEVELGEFRAAVINHPARQDFEALKQSLCLGPAMCLNEAHHDIEMRELQAARVGQHGIGLPDAGRGAEEDPQVAPCIPLGRGEQRVGIRPQGWGVLHRPRVRSASTVGDPLLRWRRGRRGGVPLRL